MQINVQEVEYFTLPGQTKTNNWSLSKKYLTQMKTIGLHITDIINFTMFKFQQHFVCLSTYLTVIDKGF